MNKKNNKEKSGVIIDFGHDLEGLKIIFTAFHDSLKNEMKNLQTAVENNDRKYANAILHKLKPNLKYFDAPFTEEFYSIENKLKDLEIPEKDFKKLTSEATEIIKKAIIYLDKTFTSF